MGTQKKEIFFIFWGNCLSVSYLSSITLQQAGRLDMSINSLNRSCQSAKRLEKVDSAENVKNKNKNETKTKQQQQQKGNKKLLHCRTKLKSNKPYCAN